MSEVTDDDRRKADEWISVHERGCPGWINLSLRESFLAGLAAGRAEGQKRVDAILSDLGTAVTSMGVKHRSTPTPEADRG